MSNDSGHYWHQPEPEQDGDNDVPQPENPIHKKYPWIKNVVARKQAEKKEQFLKGVAAIKEKLRAKQNGHSYEHGYEHSEHGFPYRVMAFVGKVITTSLIGLFFALFIVFAVCLHVVRGFSITLLHAWVLTKMWAWFMVPTFHLPAITFVQAAGIMMIVSLLKLNIRGPKMKTEKKDTDWGGTLVQIADEIIGPLMLLGLGYIIHLYMPV